MTISRLTHVAAMLGLLASSPADAQQSPRSVDPDQASLRAAVQQVQVARAIRPRPSTIEDTRLVANAGVFLRDAPPSGVFYQLGKQIGVVEKGQEVLLDDTKEVKTLFSRYVWLKVRLVDPSTGEVGADGWVYAGEKGDVSYFDLAPKGGGEMTPDGATSEEKQP